VEVLALTDELRAARERWRYRGQLRPHFAEAAGPGEESVWDFPRPPRLEEVAQRLRVLTPDDVVLADTVRGCRVLETAGAPTYYFPPEDVATGALVATPGRSLCEWKGVAESFAWGTLDPAAWSYTRTFPEFVAISGWFAFYPGQLRCFVGEEQVTPQPGGYYGGWVTAALRGPIKGEPGSGHW
jgi:uncharacterized protein (DUF427 family)